MPASLASTDEKSSDEGATSSSSAVAPRLGVSTKGRSRVMSAKKGTADVCFNMTGTGIPWLPVRKYDNKPYRIFQQFTDSNIVSSTSGTAGTFTFTLAQLTQYVAWTAVFDQYRIAEIEIWFIPRQSTISASTSNSGLLVTAVDYDGTASPSLTNCLQFTNAMVGSGFEGQYRRFVPHAAVAAYQGSFSGYLNMAAPWIDCGFPSVVHYGIDWGWTPADSANYTVDIMVRYSVDFRNVI
jgi:hypothetical protein